MIARAKRVFSLATAALAVLLVGVSSAQAAPVKLIPTSEFGGQVNPAQVTAKGGPALEDLCVFASEECQPGTFSQIAGGFEDPRGVAVQNDPASSEHDDVYVTDAPNNRVQIFTAAGAFVSMFGKEVNATTKGNICTAASENTCKAGVEGSAAEELNEPTSIAIDPSSGNVYVFDRDNHRVVEYTAEGRFVLMIGREVNATTKGNLCTAASGDLCKAGVESPGSTEPGAFIDYEGSGNVLDVGGPEHLLYVGAEHRVQEFNAEGEYKGEIPLTSIFSAAYSGVSALTVDETGDVYLVYSVTRPGATSFGDIVREFNSAGVQVAQFTLAARQPDAEVGITAIALDSSGHLAVAAEEKSLHPPGTVFGSLFDAASGRLITEFAIPFQEASESLVFADSGSMFAALTNGGGQAVVSYVPVSVAELVTGGVLCVAGSSSGSDATFACSLGGEVNPEGVEDTDAAFQWGLSLTFGGETAVQHVCASSCGSTLAAVTPAVIVVRPNTVFYDRLVGHDENVKAPELLTAETVESSTPVVAPRVVGVPSAPFVRGSSVVMFGELNPENTATEYFFEYAPGSALAQCPGGVRREACPGVASTSAAESGVYGQIGATLEATGLQPATVYHYRLAASNEHLLAGKPAGGTASGVEGAFTTGPAPVPQAVTGAAGVVGATSATIAGVVNPDGQPAIYAFELGVYAGAGTQYGVVFSGPAGSGSVPLAETLGLTGLQPGTTYAYRIRISSGYGTATGEPAVFSTEGLPSVLVSPTPLALLAIPNVAFPAPVIAPATKSVPKEAKKKPKKGKKGQRKKVKGKRAVVAPRKVKSHRRKAL